MFMTILWTVVNYMHFLHFLYMASHMFLQQYAQIGWKAKDCD